MMLERTGNTKWLLTLATVGAIIIGVGGNMLPTVNPNEDVDIPETAYVVAGVNNTQVFLKDGTRLGRGVNQLGQYGVNPTDSTVNRDWVGSSLNLAPAQKVVASNHTLYLDEDNHVYGWGSGEQGALGFGDQNPATTPGQAKASYYFDTISAGVGFVVALDDFGNVYVWGQNDSYQLGTGDTDARLRPTKLETVPQMESVTAGKNYVVGLDTENNLWVWGANSQGQLGTGDTETIVEPTQVNAKFRSVNTSIVSETTVAVGMNHKLYSWGNNDAGQLGVGEDWRKQQREENDRVKREKERIREADEQRRQNLIDACLADEAQKRAEEEEAQKQYEKDHAAWEKAKEEAEENEEEFTEPEPEPPVTEEPVDCVKKIDKTFEYTDTSGMKPRTIPEPALAGDAKSPQKVNSDRDYSMVAVGSQNVYAVTTDGTLMTWGSDANGQNGNTMDEDKHHTLLPLPVSVTDVTSVTAGDKWGGVVTSDGVSKTWGDNTGHRAGHKQDSPLLVPTKNGSGISNIIAGSNAGFAITDKGDVLGWGANTDNILLAEGTDTLETPTLVTENVASVAMSGNAIVGLRKNGNLTSWGTNTAGVFGDGQTAKKAVKKPFTDVISKFVDIAVDGNTSFAVDTRGFLWGWGSNESDRLGVTGVDYAVHPILIPLSQPSSLVTVSPSHTVVVSDDGTVRVSGAEGWGVVETGFDVEAVAADDTNVFLLTTDHKVFSLELEKFEEGKELGKFTLFGEDYETITSGGGTVAGITTDGVLYRWGDSDLFGEPSQPVKVMENVKQVSVSSTHIVAQTPAGTVYGVGNEPYGTFGTLTEPVKNPYPIAVRNNWVGVSENKNIDEEEGTS